MGADEIDRYRERLFRAFPAAEAIDTALQTAAVSKPLFFIRRSEIADLAGSWFALGRLGPELERQFQIAGEVIFLFSPHADLQRRTRNSIVGPLRREIARCQHELYGEERFTPDPNLAMLWCPDSDMTDHLEAWNAEGGGAAIAAIRNSYSRVPGAAIEEVMSDITPVMSARDLYSGKNPVTGNDFFGRQKLLTDLLADIGAGRSVSIFGLRRSGKTSIVKEFTRRYLRQNIIVFDIDIETAGSCAEVRKQLAARVTDVLNHLAESNPSIWVGDPEDQLVEDFTDLGRRLVRIAENNETYRFVVAIDEIESLARLIQNAPNEVRQLLGSLRQAAQHSDRISVLLSGVTARFFTESMLSEADQVENPMFDFLEQVFVTPFRYEETANLLTKLGKSMTLDWDQDALAEVQTASGGMPTLVRRLASDVRAHALAIGKRNDSGRIAVTSNMVVAALDGWREQGFELWSQVTRPLELHHPLMAELVHTRTDDEIEERLESGVQEWLTAADSLERLGMLERDAGKWSATPTLQAMRKLGTKSPVPVDDLIAGLRHQSDAPAARVRQLIAAKEGQEVEFKDRVKINVHTNGADAEITKPVIKTIAAFANTDGGTLLIGVTDDGGVCGIDDELKSFKKGLDEYDLFLQRKIRDHLSGSVGVDKVAVEFVDVDGRTVCLVNVQPSDEEIWFDEKNETMTFYARQSGETVALTGPAFMRYHGRRFPQSK